jgi:5,10-methylenetetrahydromethanopterin reductase
MVGEPDLIARELGRLGDAGFTEIIYTPTGPDVVRELRTMASVPRSSGSQN